MRKKVLPVHTPIIQHIPANAYLLSIIGEKEDEYEWIMNNFVNLRFNSHTGYDDFYRNDMWYNCYYITENRLTKEFLDLVFHNPIEMLTTLINADYYMYIFLNEKHIEKYGLSENFNHNAMIYGYDLDKKEVYIADFFGGNSLSFSTCALDEFCNGYIYQTNAQGYYEYVWNRAFKVKKGYKYDFNVHEFLIKLEDYLLSTDLGKAKYFSFDNNDVEEVLYFKQYDGFDYVYGISVYDAIQNALRKKRIGRRPLHLIYEHKKLMGKRISFLSKKGLLGCNEAELVQMCEEMLRLTTMVKNVFLKAEIQGGDFSDERIEFMCNKLDQIKKTDIRFTKMMLDSMADIGC